MMRQGRQPCRFAAELLAVMALAGPPAVAQSQAGETEARVGKAEAAVEASLPACELLASPLPAESGVPEQLRIGYRRDAAPFSYLDGDGRPAGYIVALCEQIGRRLTHNGHLEYVEVTAASRFLDLAEGRIDLLCDSSTLTLARTACFDHSLLTFPSGPAVATSALLPHREGALRVGVLATPSSTAARLQTRAMRQAVERALDAQSIETVELASYSDLFAALERCESNGPDATNASVHAAVADREILVARQRAGHGGLRVGETYLSYEPYTIYLRPNRDLRVAVNAALTELYASPDIHRLLHDHFPRVADPVGQLIRLQRIPPR